MTKGHGRGIGVVSLLLVSIFAPLAMASGGGLLLAGDSFSITGDQDVGVGDINISIDVVAHDVNSNGFIEISFTAGDNTLLASDNRSISLSAGQSSTEHFNVSAVPIGTHVLTLELWGDVGIGFENNVSSIQVFVQKLAPANISIDTSNSWIIVPVDSQTGMASGNSTLRNGDDAWVMASVTNSGDVPWQGNASISDINTSYPGTQISVGGQATSVMNFTIGPLFEGTSQITIDLQDGQNTIDSDSISLSIGPPPLPRPSLFLSPEIADPVLGTSINWAVMVENSGESAYNGSISCSFPSGLIILNESISIQSESNQSWMLNIDVRPGELGCTLLSSDRIHNDSVTSESHVYDMSAGHLMRAGSDGLTVTGGPFHVGDSAPLAILIHNGGDYSGVGTLEVREGDSEGNNMGAWSSLESRTLEVGSSLELGAQYLVNTSGVRQIEWRIISPDSLVASDLSGSISLNIQSSQSLGVGISSVVWSLDTGLFIEFTTMLSFGESRIVLLEVGTSGSAGSSTQISTEILLSPGQRTLTYNLGHPTSSSDAWVELTPISWASLTDAVDQTPLIHPNPVTSVVIDFVSPSPPIPGEPATISYTLVNQGNSETLPGNIMVIDMKRDGQVLWPQSGVHAVSAVGPGENYTSTINLDVWPDGSVVDLSLIWHTSNSDSTGTASFLSQVDESNEADTAIDVMSIVYGTLAGLMIGLITRTAMRARAGVPLLSRRERGERTSNPKKSIDKTVVEKVEVACPACDQRLRVPSTYSGSARCPACTQMFPVEATQEEVSESLEMGEEELDDDVDLNLPEVESTPIVSANAEKSSSSNDDIIRCPDCEQKLKVPFDRRPVRARCPACKCEFRALQG
ncbi:MAG: hypothetical protein P8Q90_03290 [Candidatus Thalassarchaeaceae archaeon]|nr:hypothetical protein [Candidatus Thalassarchaeaceae archaeon]